MSNAIDVDFATIEEIIPRPGWAIKSMCSLYGSYKACEQAMHLLDTKVVNVKARTWQKEFNLIFKKNDCPDPSKHETYKKNMHKTVAKDLAMGLSLSGPNITHNNADSFLIALYRLKIEGCFELL